MIPRLIEKNLVDKLINYDKLVILLGARQVGKTTLIQNIADSLKSKGKNVLLVNCDILEERNAVNTNSITSLTNLLSDLDFLFIDEAQRLDNPGLTLKIIHDNFKKVKVLATGSSSFELKNKLSDVLTGRYLDFYLYPLSLSEALAPPKTDKNNALWKSGADALLENLLLYGLYPEIYLTKIESDKKLFLDKITQSYLFKDILSFQKIKYPKAIKDLAKALAYQIGSEVSENELSNRLKIDRKTVISYMDILEQTFVIKRLFSFSKNPRREIGKNFKVYFLDLGIRNSLIGDFNQISLRSDAGRIWENFLFIERMKRNSNLSVQVENFFWRNYGGAQVDYIETDAETIRAFEFKYSQKGINAGSKSFTRNYNTTVKLINRNNYPEFILG